MPLVLASLRLLSFIKDPHMHLISSCLHLGSVYILLSGFLLCTMKHDNIVLF